MPTYRNYSSIENVAPKLNQLKDRFNIIIKPHHGTEYGIDELEQKRMKYLNENFKNIFSSKYSLLDLLNKCDIVITDQSGAVFDAIYVKKPVLMYYTNSISNEISLPIKCAKKGYFVSFTDLEDKMQLEKLIEQSLNSKQCVKQNKLFKKIFCPQEDIEKNFLHFLSCIENEIFDKDFYEIHQLQKKQIGILYENIQTNNITITNLNSKLDEYNNKILENLKIIDDLKEENIKIKQQNNTLIEEYNNFKKQIYNSKSWKVTKPLRYFNQLIKKVKNHIKNAIN